MMAQRMAELHRILKPTGSIYMHCDQTASHYLRLLLDAVFAAENFKNSIVWKRTSAHRTSRRWGRIQDTILFYSKSGSHTWNPTYQDYDAMYAEQHYRFEDDRGKYRLSDMTGAGTRSGDSGQAWRGINPTDSNRHWAVPARALLSAAPGIDQTTLSTQEKLDILDRAGLIHWPEGGSVPSYKRYLDESPGVLVQDVITDISPIGSRARERVGYPTQKPEALLDRIIRASSNEGDVVLDPFCGCGTAIVVAERLGRRWIGIDITHLAISIMKSRLHDTFGSELSEYDIIGVPQDLESARALAVESEHDGRYQFEYWALGLVNARPSGGGRRGADSGVDGFINFFDDNSGRAKRIVAQVKSGGVQRSQIAALKGDMEREKAEIGLFITLVRPTRPMLQEAASAGVYVPEFFPDRRYPRLQILTVEELLAGAEAQYPRFAPDATFRRAPRRRSDRGEQSSFA